MGLTKTESYTDRQNEIASILKALGHPARVAIIEQLLKVKCCISGDFAEEIALAQPTISRHLKELKAIGIIQGTIEGTSVSYCINPFRWLEIQKMMNGMFDQFRMDSDCC